MTKIEEYKNLKAKIEECIYKTHMCRGEIANKAGEYSEYIDLGKHSFEFTSEYTPNITPVFFRSYYSCPEDLNVHPFIDEFYFKCFIQAANHFMPEILTKTKEIMSEECDKLLSEAKGEIENMLKLAKEMGITILLPIQGGEMNETI